MCISPIPLKHSSAETFGYLLMAEESNMNEPISSISSASQKDMFWTSRHLNTRYPRHVQQPLQNVSSSRHVCVEQIEAHSQQLSMRVQRRRRVMNGQSSESANCSLPNAFGHLFHANIDYGEHETQRRSIKARRNRHLMSPSTDCKPKSRSKFVSSRGGRNRSWRLNGKAFL